MPTDEYNILAINPGSTSTKFAIYVNERAALVCNLRHTITELQQFEGRPMREQQEFRLNNIERELAAQGWNVGSLHAVAGRGGLLPPLPSGTYVVDEAMIEELRIARRGEHASNLGALLAWAIAQRARVKAYVVDPVSVDEWHDCARISGSALIKRSCLSHALNTKAVAKRYARERGNQYESLRLIVAHMGSGISVSAHEGGRMIDNNTGEDGPFGADRSGSVPVQQLARLCFSGQYTQDQLNQLLFGQGGLYSYLGTKDLSVVEERIADGDSRAAAIFDAMVYQISKEIGAMAAVLHGQVDAVLLTGGMARSQELVSQLCGYVNWVAPIKVYPGEDELQALAEGVLRVLRQLEQPRRLGYRSAAVPTS